MLGEMQVPFDQQRMENVRLLYLNKRLAVCIRGKMQAFGFFYEIPASMRGDGTGLQGIWYVIKLTRVSGNIILFLVYLYKIFIK